MNLRLTGSARAALRIVVCLGALLADAELSAQGVCSGEWQPPVSQHPGTNWPSNDLAVFDAGAGPKLYLAGPFAIAGSVAVDRMATWDGNAFAPVAGCPVPDVRRMTVHDDGSGAALYVAGLTGQTSGSSLVASTIARLQGTAWTTIARVLLNLDETITRE